MQRACSQIAFIIGLLFDIHQFVGITDERVDVLHGVSPGGAAGNPTIRSGRDFDAHGVGFFHKLFMGNVAAKNYKFVAPGAEYVVAENIAQNPRDFDQYSIPVVMAERVIRGFQSVYVDKRDAEIMGFGASHPPQRGKVLVSVPKTGQGVGQAKAFKMLFGSLLFRTALYEIGHGP